MFVWKQWCVVSLCLTIILFGFNPFGEVVNATRDQSPVKNVIFMIPDGFSSAYATNYRIFNGNEFILDSMLVGMMKTHSASSWVTDSAAAATAMATGVKTKNGMIGVDSEGQQLKTILEASNEAGKSTGLIATKAITDATPAAFGAHVISRTQEEEIASQLLEQVDVLFGGGKCHFLPSRQDKQDLIEEARSNGYQLIETREELIALQGTEKKVLGLFADQMLAAEIDRDQTDEPSLAEMTEMAIELLSENDEGFFLMVEGSKIDRAGHAHDAAWAMNDIAAFEQAVIKAKDFAEKDAQTLLLVVGDHDTGGLSVGGYNEYVAKPEMLRNVKASAAFISAQINNRRTNVQEVMKEYTNFDFTKKEIKKIKTASTKEVPFVIGEIISEKAYIDWVTTEHTGVDVPIYAFGPKAHYFQGHLDNTELPKKIAQAMELTF
ncbi:alkaline phosphatase [Halalkalibacter alkalisediminis]|uniref:Alkaline phosphatase n=1 Tax=Halalkalibacter alkalisediminis TaxID=935616 RepID=A0ABV6NH17_9BACI|nr:alkaline phosphatase [Halalkalibacter alkalisediminis]